MFGPGERDIQQPHILRQFLFLGEPAVLLVNLGPEVSDQLRVLLGIMKEHLLLKAPCDLRPPFDFRPFPGEHAKDDRVLQAFALVDRDQPHCIFIPLQPQLMFLRSLLIRVHLLGEPFQSTADSEPTLGFGLVKHLPQVEHVRKSPLPIREGQQPLPHLFHLQPAPKHPEEPLAIP